MLAKDIWAPKVECKRQTDRTKISSPPHGFSTRQGFFRCWRRTKKKHLPFSPTEARTLGRYTSKYSGSPGGCQSSPWFGSARWRGPHAYSYKKESQRGGAMIRAPVPVVRCAWGGTLGRAHDAPRVWRAPNTLLFVKQIGVIRESIR